VKGIGWEGWKDGEYEAGVERDLGIEAKSHELSEWKVWWRQQKLNNYVSWHDLLLVEVWC
jgi:hypothetical protein